MGNRTIERSIAKNLYADFCAKWRREKRLAGKYGKPGIRRPNFNQWLQIHGRDQLMMSQSTPVDVQEYLGHDPWTLPEKEKETSADRSVVTVPISGDPI